jgi:hypothetical protein
MDTDGSGDGYSLYLSGTYAPANGSATDASPGNWQYVVASLDESITTEWLYVDGSQTGIETSATFTQNSDNLWVGALQPGGSGAPRAMDGQMDEVRVSGTAAHGTADWVDAEYTNQNSPTTFYNVASESVDITVYVHHTATDGTGATLITSASTTINANTADPLLFDVGNDAIGQTFTSADPRVLRVQVEVTAVNGGASFVIDYDGPCASNACSSLDTPVIVVPENAVALLVVVMLIPLVVSGSRNKNWLKLLRKRIRNVSSRCRQILASQISQASQRVARLPRDDTRSE